ncbi:hypothetical protein KC322_g15744 [Hortaea werneckii]|nr:hypothetical protein KC322_g15744 [Hortaea werneckii]
MLLMTTDVKGGIEGASVKTMRAAEVGEETTDDMSLIQKMSTGPATLDDIETTRTDAKVETGRNHKTSRDEDVATVQDHPDTNDAGDQKAAPARHLRGKPAGPYHPKTNPTASSPPPKSGPA